MDSPILQRAGRVFRAVWLVLFIAFGLWFVAQQLLAQADQLRPPLQFAPTVLAAAAVCQVLFWFLSALYWRSIVQHCSAKTITIAQSLAQFSLLTIGKYFPGKVWGMIARGAYMARSGVDIGTKAVAIATFYEQLLILHSAVVLAGTVLAWLFLDAVLALAATVVLVATAALAPCLLRFGSRLLRFIIRRLTKIRADEPEPTLPEMSWCDYLRRLVAYAGIWVINGSVFSAIYFSFFDAGADMHTVAILIVANTVSITAGFLALFAPGGIGVREAVASAILVGVMPLSDAVLLSVFYRLWLVIVDLMFGAALAIAIGRSRHRGQKSAGDRFFRG